jgi:very-short-patch-repair endonuclease
MVYHRKVIERNMYFGAKPDLFEMAKENRKNPTAAEKVLWNILRKYRNDGFLFRQQHPIYLFIADFYCHKINLVVEVDGGVHFNEESQEHDDGRTGVMEGFGIKVIRFTNEQVLYHRDVVINQINNIITEAANLTPSAEVNMRMSC